MKQTPYQRYEHAGMSLPERAFPHRILEGVWLWSVYREETESDCNGYLIQTQGQQAFLVDPPCAGPEVLTAFEALPVPHSIFLTTAQHERASHWFRHYFHIPVFAPEQDADQLEYAPDHTYRGGMTLPNGWQAITLTDQSTAGECALYQPIQRLLIVGDALLGQPFQQLSLNPIDKNLRDRIQGLQVLRGLRVDTVLTGHGDPVLQRGQSFIQEALLDSARILMASELA